MHVKTLKWDWVMIVGNSANACKRAQRCAQAATLVHGEVGLQGVLGLPALGEALEGPWVLRSSGHDLVEGLVEPGDLGRQVAQAALCAYRLP